jgi:methionyl-tRNA formyltransferase
MRIVFVGAVEFSRHCLEETLKNGGNVVAVITIAKEKAKLHSDYTDLSSTAQKYHLPVYRVKNINDPEGIELIRSLKPDVIFVFGWSQLISKPILGIPSVGCIGTHPALLPRNRGRHPIIWALREGLQESGLTFFYLDEGSDSGDLLWQKSFSISLDDDAGTLYEKIKLLATEAIREFLPQLERGTAPRIPQDHSQATYWRKRTEKDGEINWASPAMDIYNLIRALARPYVGAHTFLVGGKVVIWRARFPEKPLPASACNADPGTVFGQSDGRFDVRCRDGYLTIVEYESVEGAVLEVGSRLGGSGESACNLGSS